MDICFFNGNAIDIKMKCSNNAHECSYNLHFHVSILNKLLAYRRTKLRACEHNFCGILTLYIFLSMPTPAEIWFYKCTQNIEYLYFIGRTDEPQKPLKHCLKMSLNIKLLLLLSVLNYFQLLFELLFLLSYARFSFKINWRLYKVLHTIFHNQVCSTT